MADEESAGYVAGALASTVPLGRIFTATLWGMVADKLGTRAALCLSMVSVSAGNLLFGFVRPLWAAAAARFVLIGMGNGFPTLIGLLAADVGGQARQTHVIGYLTTAFTSLDKFPQK